MIFIYFLYGLAFFTLGVSLLVREVPEGILELRPGLRWLALFALAHAATEWLDAAKLIGLFGSEVYANSSIALFGGASFAALLVAGLFLTIPLGRWDTRAAILVTIAFIVVWLVLLLVNVEGHWRFAVGDITARWLLGAPGAFLASTGLYIQSRALMRARQEKLASAPVLGVSLKPLRLGLLVAAVSLAAYGLLTLPGSKADFPPADVVNADMFQQAFGFPIQIARTLAAILLATSMVTSLRQFHKIDRMDLESQIEKRTSQLVEKQNELHQAQKMEAVGQLTGGVAHEFNNLLFVILGNIEAIDSRLEKDDPLQSYSSSAMKGVARGAELTQSLLAFSRTQRLESGQIDLNELITGMQHLTQRTLGETITIVTDLADGLWSTSADAGQTEGALLNFVLNARDAMPDGGTITIRTSNKRITAEAAAHYDQVGAGDYVTVEVSDTGTGMTVEQIEHAFEPFYTTKKVGEGTGLGLSVAYGFAKQSGGCLEIECEIGQDTTVRLSLPRAAEEDIAARRAKDRSTEAVNGNGVGRILVVEDDAEVRALLIKQLTELGYEVVEAGSGPEALVLLDRNPEIDVLFSDVVLPGGMSGPEAARTAHQKHPHLRVLFTSGYPQKDIDDLSVGGKDASILRKPYRKSELAEAIAAVMNSA